MKTRKISGIVILTLALTLAFGIMAYAKDALYTETDEVVGISNITELKEAGTNASIDSTDPTVIELVADISTGDRFDIAGTANAKKCVTLKGDYELSLTGRKEFYGKNAFVRIEKAEVVIEDVTINANHGGGAYADYPTGDNIILPGSDVEITIPDSITESLDAEGYESKAYTFNLNNAYSGNIVCAIIVEQIPADVTLTIAE